MAAYGPLDVPRCSFVDVFLRQGKCIVHDSLLQGHAEEKLADPVDVGPIVGVLHDSLASFKTESKPVAEDVPREDILDPLASLLLLDLPSVCFVDDDGALKHVSKMLSLPFLLLQVVELVASLDALERANLLLRLESCIENHEGLFEDAGL